MLLIPTGLENRPVLRTPWVTWALIAANTTIAVVTTSIDAARNSNVVVTFDLIEKSLQERPYLKIPDGLGRFVDRAQLARLEQGLALERARGASPASAARRQAEQQALDSLVSDLQAALDRLPARRFGFVPARPTLVGLLASMFLHGGWLHLLGNMLFLYVSGPYMEDVYGRRLFLLSYLASGLVATGGHYLAAPQSQAPLVGASGAIAGVMGMLLVRLWRSRVRFVCLPFVVPVARFNLSLPAVVVLPLWFLEQLWYSQRASQGAGVAWWAHVSGFLFGCGTAALVKLLRLEPRWLGSAFVSEPLRALDNVVTAREAGQYESARAALRDVLRTEPESVEAWREAYELALVEGDSGEVARALSRLLELLPRRAEPAAVTELVEDQRWRLLVHPSTRLLLSIAAALEQHGDTRRALEHYDTAIHTAATDPAALRAFVKKGELLAKLGDNNAARAAFARALAHPACSDVWRTTVERALGKVASGAGAPTAR